MLSILSTNELQNLRGFVEVLRRGRPKPGDSGMARVRTLGLSSRWRVIGFVAAGTVVAIAGGVLIAKLETPATAPTPSAPQSAVAASPAPPPPQPPAPAAPAKASSVPVAAESKSKIIYTHTFEKSKPFQYRWDPKTNYTHFRNVLPAGMWLGCYEPASGGAFSIIKFDDGTALGLGSRRGPPRAQFSIKADKLTGGLQPGRNYTLEFEYRTRGEPGAAVTWLNENYVGLASKGLPKTDGLWQTDRLTVRRPQAAILVNLDSRELSDDGMLYIRKLSLIDEGL
jgi:hypothetical protein